MTSHAGDTLVYDAENHLTQVTSVGGMATTYGYDADGNRAKQVVTSGSVTLTTYYVGNHYEVTGTTATSYYYLGTQRVAVRHGNDVYYLHSDHPSLALRAAPRLQRV